MTVNEAVNYIESYGFSRDRIGLERSYELLNRLGNPQKELKFIHVAGSNGKGSSCAMFDSILRSAGYRCGLFTSPYIQDFCERIQLCGENISEADLARITEKVKAAAESMNETPTQFEIITAIAMQFFFEKKAEIVVLEVGLGGEYDATNVIDCPELACIANIGLEHTEYLGSSIEEIAQAKAGIIKESCSCVCYDAEKAVTKVVSERCDKLHAQFVCVDFSKLMLLNSSLDGQTFIWKGKEYFLSLIGPHQLHNAALVLTGIEVLNSKSWNIPDTAIRQGLKNVKWPARLEVLNKDPIFILGGGHNSQCAAALADSIDLLIPGKKAVILTGVLSDKDYGAIYDCLLPYAEKFVCITPDSERALPATKLAAYLQGKGVDAVCAKTYEEGIGMATELANGGAVIAFGSLYMAGEIRTIKGLH